jgi:hypothetical protein
MRFLIVALCLLTFSVPAEARRGGWVRGYVRSNGTYVRPYVRGLGSYSRGRIFSYSSATYPNFIPPRSARPPADTSPAGSTVSGALASEAIANGDDGHYGAGRTNDLLEFRPYPGEMTRCNDGELAGSGMGICLQAGFVQ